MIAAFILALAALGFAGYLSLRTVRGGWFGLPIAVAAMIAIWFLSIGMANSMESPSMLFGASIAGIAAAGLPRLDKIIIGIAAPVLSYYFFEMFPTHDSPLGPMAGASLAGSALGALLALATSLMQRERLTR